MNFSIFSFASARVKPCKSMVCSKCELIFFIGCWSLSWTFSFELTNFCQSRISLSVVFLFNQASVWINCQLGFWDLTFRENFQVSFTFLIFWGSPEIILFSLSFMQVIISLTKFTVTSKRSFFCSWSLISAELIPMNVVSFLIWFVDLSFSASLKES